MEQDYPLSARAEGVLISVRATPRAGRNELAGVRNGRLQVKVTAAPEDGAANVAVIKLLRKQLGIAASRVELVSGAANREKLLLVAGMELGAVAQLLRLPPPPG